MALSAVVLPAPLGPMSPRMRPSSTRRFTPSSATVAPNDFRRSRASMQGMGSSLPFSPGVLEQLFRLEAEPLDVRADPGPLVLEELPPFTLEQPAPRAGV